MHTAYITWNVQEAHNVLNVHENALNYSQKRQYRKRLVEVVSATAWSSAGGIKTEFMHGIVLTFFVLLIPCMSFRLVAKRSISAMARSVVVSHHSVA